MNINKTAFRFKFFDMPASVSRTALVASAILIVICTVFAIIFTDLTPLDSLIAGILAVGIHWLSYLLHQYGHFLAAKFVGKPSTGVRLWGFLGATRYPQDEGTLSPEIHIKRASGGPAMSTVVLIVFLILDFFFASYSPMAAFLLRWGIFVQAVGFILGALTPISIGDFNTDGATILQNYRDMRKSSA